MDFLDNDKMNWLLENNLCYSSFRYMLSSEYFNRNVELQTLFNDRKNGKLNLDYWRFTAIPIFSGDICFLENETALTSEDIAASSNAFKEYVNAHVVSTSSKAGISVCEKINSTSLLQRKGRFISPIMSFSYPEDVFTVVDCSITPHLPKFSRYYSWNFGKDSGGEKPRPEIRHISEVGIDDMILLRPVPTIKSMSNVMDKLMACDDHDFVTGMYNNFKRAAGEDIIGMHESLKRVIDNGILKYKFNIVNDFGIDFSLINNNQPDCMFKSFENFPNEVCGSLLINSLFSTCSYQGFPQLIKHNCYFNNCLFTEVPTLPSGIKIMGRMVINSGNPHYMLKAIADSDIEIEGGIYSPVFVGPTKCLKDFIKGPASYLF